MLNFCFGMFDKQHDKFLIGSANFLHYWSDRKMVIGLLITFHLSKLFTIYKVKSLVFWYTAAAAALSDLKGVGKLSNKQMLITS